MNDSNRSAGDQRSARARRARAVGPVRRAALVWIVALATVMLGTPVASAQSAVHEILWGHREPDRVSGFVLLVSSAPGGGVAERRVRLGKPVTSRLGPLTLFMTALTLRPDEFVSIVAIGSDGIEGRRSPWSSLPPTSPGQPVLVQ